MRDPSQRPADATARMVALRHDPPPPSAEAREYRSTDCRMGTHATCTEGTPRRDPALGVSYQTCECGCHQRLRAVAS